jgi:hypothetical protein
LGFWGYEKKEDADPQKPQARVTPPPATPGSHCLLQDGGVLLRQKRFAFAPVFPFVLIVPFVVSNPGNHEGHKEHEAEHEFVNNRC